MVCAEIIHLQQTNKSIKEQVWVPLMVFLNIKHRSDIERTLADCLYWQHDHVLKALGKSYPHPWFATTHLFFEQFLPELFTNELYDIQVFDQPGTTGSISFN